MITVHGIKCLSCGEIVYSRARHDWISCKCGAVFADGGFDYGRFGYTDPGLAKQVTLEIDCTQQGLFKDWNLRIDKFGRIENK